MDTFSLGILLYELFSGGYYPFFNDIPKNNAKVLPIRGYNDNIPELLAKWLEKACQPNKNNRYKSAVEMVDDFIKIYPQFGGESKKTISNDVEPTSKLVKKDEDLHSKLLSLKKNKKFYFYVE